MVLTTRAELQFKILRTAVSSSDVRPFEGAFNKEDILSVRIDLQQWQNRHIANVRIDQQLLPKHTYCVRTDHAVLNVSLQGGIERTVAMAFSDLN